MQMRSHHMHQNIWGGGMLGAQSCSDPPPANTHVIKTDMDCTLAILCDLLSGQGIMKTPLDISVQDKASQDTELMICLLQSF